MRIRQDPCALRRIALVAAVFSSPTAPSLAQEVTLPLAEYEAMLERTEPPDVVAPSSPTPIVLESAVSEIVVGRDTARVVTEMTLVVYEEGWRTLELPPDGSLTAVELGELEGRVGSSANDASDRLLSCRGVGRHTIRLHSVVPVETDAAAARATRRLALRFPWAGTVTGHIESDDSSDRIELESGALLDRSSEPGRVAFIGEPGGSLSLRILGDSGTVSDREVPLGYDALAFAMTRVGRSRIELTGYLELDIHQGTMESVRLSIPESMSVLDVTGTGSSGIELGWDVDAAGMLVIRFAEPAAGKVPIELSLARSSRLDDALASFEAPVLAPEGASRVTLVSGLAVEEDGIVILLDRGSARRAAEDDLALLREVGRAAAGSLFVVREASSPPAFRFEWPEADPAAVLASQVDRLVVDALVGEAGRTAYQYWAVVRSAGASSLTFQPPPGFVLVAAERAGRRVTPGQTAEGIVVPLAPGLDAQVVLLTGIVEGSAPPDKGLFTIPIPALSAPVARVELRAVVPGGRRYELDTPGLEERIGGAPTGRFFSAPASHELVTAAFSALDPRPSPVDIRSRPEREKRRWH